MQTFADYVRYYNNHDVIGLVGAIEKWSPSKINVFKESVSLPGLTRKYLFTKLQRDNEYFAGIGKEHRHIYKDLKERCIVGGPSIIFHRYQVAGETKIKGKETYKKIIGFDANSLYLWCTAQQMPTGYYCLRKKSITIRGRLDTRNNRFNGENI